jgi:SAM-dependent methyltransferase
MNLLSPIKSIKSGIKYYYTLPNSAKLMAFITILLFIIVLFKYLNKHLKEHKIKEGMVDFKTMNLNTTAMGNENVGTTKFLFKEGEAIYDNFYANIYDHLLYSNVKNNFELGIIINNTSPTEKSIIADIGCGTGHHTKYLHDEDVKITGVDISPSMIKTAKETYPDLDLKVGNALNERLFNISSLTHVLCLYFTIYYFPDKSVFFHNCMEWLMPGGYLIVHLVDKEKFDPILPPGNPLYIVSPQKYAKERITHTKITFHDFVYQSKFNLDNNNNNICLFEEKFKFNDGKTRKHEHKLYMEDTTTIINMAQDAGLILHEMVDMGKCAYENQFLYIFTKPG